jgi:L-fucose isomerase-like protein
LETAASSRITCARPGGKPFESAAEARLQRHHFGRRNDQVWQRREPGDAQKCADLFKQHRDEIDGVLVTLPNFGEERAIANALRWAEPECAGAGPRLPG